MTVADMISEAMSHEPSGTFREFMETILLVQKMRELGLWDAEVLEGEVHYGCAADPDSLWDGDRCLGSLSEVLGSPDYPQRVRVIVLKADSSEFTRAFGS